MERSVRKDIKRRYRDMLFRLEKGNKGRENCYVCSNCGNITKTIDIDDGITPRGIECPFCHSDAYSTDYDDVSPKDNPTYEFYRPTLDDTLEMVDKQFFTVNIILSGGLIRRVRKC